MPPLSETMEPRQTRGRSRKSDATAKTATKKKRVTVPKKTEASETRKIPVKRGRPPQIKTVRARVQAVLLELMAESESDAVRVSAAKTLLDKLKLYEIDEHAKDGKAGTDGKERTLQQAALLLEQLAATKSGGLSLPSAMDSESADSAIDAAGKLADLADYGRARLGQDADGG